MLLQRRHTRFNHFLCVGLIQLADVVHVTGDQLIVRTLTQCDQGTRYNIDESPGKLTERRTVALPAQLPGDTASDLRDAFKTPNGVIACRDIRPAQMEDEQLIPTAGTVGFSPNTPQQVSIPFRIKHNGDVTAANILGDQQFRQAGLTDTGSAQHQAMPYAFAQCHRDIELIGFNTMDRRVPPDRWQRPHRIEWRILAQQLGQPRQGIFGFKLQSARHLVQLRRLNIFFHFRPTGIHQALGVLLLPTETPPQEQPLLAHRDLSTFHDIAR